MSVGDYGRQVAQGIKNKIKAKLKPILIKWGLIAGLVLIGMLILMGIISAISGGSNDGGDSSYIDIDGNIYYGNTTEETVWLTLRAAGYSEEQVAGIMGNIFYESGFNYQLVEYGYTENNGGIGLVQWTNSPRDATTGRNQRLKKYAKSKGINWNTETSGLECQLEFLIAELKGGGEASYGCSGWSNPNYKGPFEKSTTASDAAYNFLWGFEIPAGDPTAERTSKANEYLKKYHGVVPNTGGVVVSGNFLKIAQQVHEAQKNRTYGVQTNGNIKKTLESDRYIVCASYVACVLYKSGYVSENEMNNICNDKVNYYSGYHWTPDISKLLQKKGWKKSTDFSKIKAGDVWIGSGQGEGHAMICVTPTTYYSSGGERGIGTGGTPQTWGSTAKNEFSYFLRAPGK